MGLSLNSDEVQRNLALVPVADSVSMCMFLLLKHGINLLSTNDKTVAQMLIFSEYTFAFRVQYGFLFSVLRIATHQEIFVVCKQ